MAEWRKVKLSDLWIESKIESVNPNSDKRITVRLNVQGVEKRPDRNDEKGATKYYIRKAGQFIYGRQNFHKGAFGIIPKELDNFESSSDIPSFDINKECNPEWIYYFFKQGGLYKELEKYSKGTGSKRIHPDKIGHLEIPLPPRKEQDKILNELKLQEKKISELFSIDNKNENYITKLRQQILKEAVQGKLTKQDSKEESAKELLKKIKSGKEKLIKEGKIKKEKPLPLISDDEIPYELPSGWEWVRLGDICRLITKGSSPNWQGVNYIEDKDKGILFVTSENVNSFNLKLINKKYLEKKFNEIEPRSILKKGDFLMNIVGASIGRTAIFDLDIEDANINQAVCLIRMANSLIDSKYLLNFFNSTICINYMYDKQVDMARPNLSMGNISQFLIPIPSLSEQKRIVEKVDKLMTDCDELEKQIKENQVNSEKLLVAVLKESFEK